MNRSYKKYLIVMMFFIILLYMSGCGGSNISSNQIITSIAPETSEIINNISQFNSPEDVINDYVKNINNKDYVKLYDDFSNTYQDLYFKEGPDDGRLRIDKYAEIKELIDKTDTLGPYSFNKRLLGDVYSYRIFYAEIFYKSDFNDEGSLFRSKITVIKENKESSWKIGDKVSVLEDWNTNETVDCLIDDKDDIASVMYEYVQNINSREYQKAYEKLSDEFKPGMEGTSKAIKHMEIKTLIDKTGYGRWSFNNKTAGIADENVSIVDAYKIYYAEIDYKLNDSQGYLKDGINYFKITLLKKKGEAEWKIAEMSGQNEKGKYD